MIRRFAPVLVFAGWVAAATDAGAQTGGFDSGVEPELRNVRNAADFKLPPAVQDAVVRHGFGIDRGAEMEFYPAYTGERYPFVTTDSLLHAYYLLYSEVLSQMEERVFRPALIELHGRLNRRCAEALRGDASWGRAAAYVAVAARLLDPAAEVDPAIAGLVEAELALVRAARGRTVSPVWSREIDYSTFRVRGTYAHGENRARYFRCMAWHHRGLFRLDSAEETRDALRLVELLAADAHDLARWQEMDRWLAWFVGPPDDPDVAAYRRLAVEVCGDRPSRQVADDPERLRAFRERAAALPRPAVCGEVLGPGRTPGFAETTRGFRLFPERRTPTGVLFQEVMLARDGFPSGLDVAATLIGWSRARALLDAAGTPALPARNLAAIRSAADGGRPVHHEVEFLHVLAALAPAAGGKDPAFLRSPAWQDKTINTALGAWVEAQHAIALHAKDANLYKGMNGRFPRFPGWVESVPEFFARLGALVRETLRRFEEDGIFDRLGPSPAPAQLGQLPAEVSGDHFRRLIALLEGLRGVALAQEAGRPLTFDERKLLERFGEELKQLAFNVSNLDEPPEDIAKAVDLATELAAGKCLETAVGRVFPIYVVVPSVYGPMLCRGGVYSYYEFLHPLSERLTDEAWREIVARGGPEAEPWVAGKGLGVRAWAEVPLTLADVRDIERQFAQTSDPQNVPVEAMNRYRHLPWHRPVPPECGPALMALAEPQDAPVDLVRFVAEVLRDWDDPRATAFYARARAFQPRKGTVADGWSTWNHYTKDLGSDHPLYGAPPADVDLLGSLLAGDVRRMTAPDVIFLHELWRRYSLQGLCYGCWVFHGWDTVADAIADGLWRLDPDGAARAFAHDLREPDAVCQGFRQLYRRRGREVFPILKHVVASATGPVLHQAIAVLADSKDPEARTCLRELFEIGSLEVRFAAAQAMLGIGPGESENVEDLLFAGGNRLFGADPFGEVDGRVEREEAARLLAGLLRSRRPPGLSREYAGWIAIAGQWRMESLGAEVAALVTEEAALGNFGRVCRAGVSALGELGGEPGVAALQVVATALQREPADRHVTLRGVLASSLLLRDLPSVADWLPDLIVRPDLDRQLRYGLVEGLGRLDRPLAGEIVQKILAHPQASEQLREQVQEGQQRHDLRPTGPSEDPASVEVTAGERERFHDIREDLGRGDVDAALRRFVAEPDGTARRRILGQLAAQSVAQRSEFLILVARHADLEVRRAAIDSAVAPGFDSATILCVLGAALADSDRSLALRAARRLVSFGDEAERVLYQAIGDASPWKRTVAAVGLAQGGWGDACDLLEHLLSDPDPWVRTAAAVAVVVSAEGRLADATADVLAEAIAGSDPALRAYVRTELQGWAERSPATARDPRWDRILAPEPEHAGPKK